MTPRGVRVRFHSTLSGGLTLLEGLATLLHRSLPFLLLTLLRTTPRSGLFQSVLGRRLTSLHIVNHSPMQGSQSLLISELLASFQDGRLACTIKPGTGGFQG